MGKCDLQRVVPMDGAEGIPYVQGGESPLRPDTCSCPHPADFIVGTTAAAGSVLVGADAFAELRMRALYENPQSRISVGFPRKGLAGRSLVAPSSRMASLALQSSGWLPTVLCSRWTSCRPIGGARPVLAGRSR